MTLPAQVHLFWRGDLREHILDLRRRKQIVVPRLDDEHRRARLTRLIQDFAPAVVSLCDRTRTKHRSYVAVRKPAAGCRVKNIKLQPGVVEKRRLPDICVESRV